MLAQSKPLHVPTTIDRLPKHWRWERLDKVCQSVVDCPHSTPILTADGPFVARSQDVRSGIFRMEEAGHVSEETYRERIDRAEPRRGDLLYSREGTYFGIAAEIPDGVRVCLGQRMVLLRPTPNETHFRFLRYWLNSPVMARHIHGYRDGTVAERLNMPTIRALPVAVPPLAEQRAIAEVLGALDDKIELNRRMNETLEALAKTEFRRMMEEGGGREVTLPEVIEVNPPRPLRKGEVAPYLDMGNMPTRSARALDVYDREFGSGMRFMDGDTLVARITPCLENGKTCFVDFLGEGKVGWGSTEYIVLRPKPPLPVECAYHPAEYSVRDSSPDYFAARICRDGTR